MKFKLKTMLLTCLIAALACMVVYERQRADQLAARVSQLEAPILNAIAQQKWVIAKRTLQLEYATKALESQLETTKNSSPAIELTMPEGFRRESANIRNSRLKLDREKAILKKMQVELEGLRGSEPVDDPEEN